MNELTGGRYIGLTKAEEAEARLDRFVSDLLPDRPRRARRLAVAPPESPMGEGDGFNPFGSGPEPIGVR